jgi:hypothetical protein
MEQNLGRIREIMGMRRKRKILTLRKEDKAKQKMVTYGRITFRHLCKTIQV